MKSNRFIGSILILIGTVIGAGILALPLVSAAAGFTWAAFLMVAVWALMMITGLLVLEVNLALDTHACTFSSMAEKTLGKAGKIITWVAYLLLLYSLTSAYMAGAASLLTSLCDVFFHVKIPSFVNAFLFTLVFGGMVFWSTQATDYTNRSLLSCKGILLFITLVFLMPHINIGGMLQIQHINNGKYLIAMAPIFLCAFGYHNVIPSLRMYLGDKPRELKQIIVWGTITTLIIYLLWLAAILGIVPLNGEHSFNTIINHNRSVGELIKTITLLINNKWLSIGINGFSNIAMTTSFLGVTLSLFDFLADGFKRSNSRFGRAQTALLTFIPPLIFAFYFPHGFVLALEYAAIFVAIITVILPALMAYKLRKNTQLKSPYRVFGGNALLFLIIIAGCAVIIFQILNQIFLIHF